MQIEAFPYQPSALGNFILGKSILGYRVTGTLPTIIPAFLYEEYADDADLQAFVSAYNELAQGYLDWFNSTTLPLYTSDAINLSLLDWTAQGIYGIIRPVIAAVTSRTTGAMNSYAMNTRATNSLRVVQSGSAQVATDDYYKRTLTWYLYAGDGRQMSTSWIRRRVARFLYGVNGADVPVSSLLNVSISRTKLPAVGATNSYAMNTQAMNTRKARTADAKRMLLITIPTSAPAKIFASMLQQGILAMPFQTTFLVALT